MSLSKIEIFSKLKSADWIIFYNSFLYKKSPGLAGDNFFLIL